MPLVRAMARTAVVAGTASAVSGRVHHRQQARWAAQEEEQYQQQQAAYAPPPPAAPAADDYTAEIERLAQLRNQGILTPEEFEAKKRQILGI